MGSKASSQHLLHSLGRPDLMFAFGSHFGGHRADFFLAHPSADELGKINKVKMWIVGGDHWLTDESRNGRILRGVNLTVTQNGLPVGLHLPLMQPLIMDRDMDQLVTLEWHIPETPGGNHLPTSIRRCYMDCTQSGSAQGLKAEEQYLDAQD